MDNIPADLTPTAIRKHFPHCAACSTGNMAQRPAPSVSDSSRDLADGEEIVVDIKVICSGPHEKHKKTFGGSTCALTAIDVATNFHWGFLLKTQKHLEEPLELIRQEIASTGRQLKTIRTDNQFLTRNIKAWARNHPPIKILACIPHELHQIGLVERFNRTIEDSIVKNLDNSPHLTI